MTKPDFVKSRLDFITSAMAGMNSKAKAETKPKLDFVPVIFANGIDCDVYGMMAAMKSQRVQYGDKIYLPDEAIMFNKVRFGFTDDVQGVNLNGGYFSIMNLLSDKYTFECIINNRMLTFRGCSYKVLARPRM